MVAEVGNFKGNKVLIMKEDEEDKYPFTIGITKAKKILAHLKDIEDFVEENG